MNQYGLNQMSNMHQHNLYNQNFDYFHGYPNNNINLPSQHHHNLYEVQSPLSSHNQYHSLNSQPSYQQSDFFGLNHTHHYHTQNIMGIGNSLPINAKFPS